MLRRHHGRGGWRITDRDDARPALIVVARDSGARSVPAATIDYTVTVRNEGNADATGVRVEAPLPANTTFVSAAGGKYIANLGKVRFDDLVVPAGGSIDVTFSVRIAAVPPATVHAVVLDHVTVDSKQKAETSSSPLTTPFAAPRAVTVTPIEQTGGARTGASVDLRPCTSATTDTPRTRTRYTATGGFPAVVLDATCAAPRCSRRRSAAW